VLPPCYTPFEEKQREREGFDHPALSLATCGRSPHLFFTNQACHFSPPCGNGQSTKIEILDQFVWGSFRSNALKRILSLDIFFGVEPNLFEVLDTESDLQLANLGVAIFLLRISRIRNRRTLPPLGLRNKRHATKTSESHGPCVPSLRRACITQSRKGCCTLFAVSFPAPPPGLLFLIQIFVRIGRTSFCVQTNECCPTDQYQSNMHQRNDSVPCRFTRMDVPNFPAHLPSLTN